MGLSDAMDISVSGIEAQRLTMELIASNIANINTTRSIYGGPYRRRVAILEEKPLVFDELLTKELRKVELGSGGVEIIDVVEDQSPLQKVYRPDHPDADAQGFVSMPNVNLSTEMVDMIYASRLYEANITAFNASKKMAQDVMQLP